MTPLVFAARRYLGVRFVHRGRLPHKLDCVGLVRRAYVDCGTELEDFTLYGREPNLDLWNEVMERNLGAPVSGPMQPGDVVSLKTLLNPHHVAIVGDYPERGHLSLIHASGEHGRVVEHRLSPDYAKRIVRVYRRVP